FKARLQAIGAEGMVSWELRAGETKKLPLAELCWWGEWAETRPQTQVVLVDGSLIVAEVIGIDKEHLAADWSLGGGFKLPLEWVGGILLAPPVDRQQADALRSIVAFRSAKERSFAERKATLPSDTDRLILLNGDE